MQLILKKKNGPTLYKVPLTSLTVYATTNLINRNQVV